MAIVNARQKLFYILVSYLTQVAADLEEVFVLVVVIVDLLTYSKPILGFGCVLGQMVLKWTREDLVAIATQGLVFSVFSVFMCIVMS